MNVRKKVPTMGVTRSGHHQKRVGGITKKIQAQVIRLFHDNSAGPVQDLRQRKRDQRMFKRRNRSRRFVGTLILTALLAVSAYAFTAQNTVEASQAGDGTAMISGFDVTGVHYNLSATDPASIGSWEFDLDGTATDVQSKVDSTSSTYAPCTNAGTHWTCTPGAGDEPTVLAADELRVIAVS